MRQKRAHKTKLAMYPKDDPRRWGPGKGSTRYARWLGNLSDEELASLKPKDAKK